MGMQSVTVSDDDQYGVGLRRLTRFFGRDSRDRTYACGRQKTVPYHLAMPHQTVFAALSPGLEPGR